MKKYEIWEFTYLNYGKDNINAITGTKEEADSEHEIPCFNGISYFSLNGKFFVAEYPKYNKLTRDEIASIEIYCGFSPFAGCYGVIMGALGQIREVSKEEYEEIAKMYPLRKKDLDCVYV